MYLKYIGRLLARLYLILKYKNVKTERLTHRKIEWEIKKENENGYYDVKKWTKERKKKRKANSLTVKSGEGKREVKKEK